MNQFPPEIRFRYNWRNYQQRVLDELESHLDDNHLHVIAPPGSGKTILGLEVARRLNKPTLIFAPTVAIRNQWIQRFCELFLRIEQKPDWISRDIKQPRFLTVVTYQALHAACLGMNLDEETEDSEEEQPDELNGSVKYNKILPLLQAQNFGTIVVDEAHHLKNAWWRSLTEVKRVLNPTVVGLTATPPYDVSHQEWQRYVELNGPVDAEISVPELVAEGNLCPHQDYIFFSLPSKQEHLKIHEFRQRMQTLFEEIKTDETISEALQNHPIYQSPKNNLEWIYSNLEYYSALLIYLNARGVLVTGEHLDVVGDKTFTVPELNFEWMEVLLTFYLYKDPENFAPFKVHQEKIKNKLKRSGALERRSVSLRHNHRIDSFLSSSISKLNSIDRVVKFEHGHLGNSLRMVILTDFIRKEFLVNKPINDLELNKIGVLPIFEQLRRNDTKGIKIGVLTGSLVIIPSSSLDVFKETAAKYGIGNVSTSTLAFDNGFSVVNTTDKIKHDIVHIVTQVFQQGEIEVLIGTKSLLGEGWDAPSINSLVLASFVGSYVLSNQMRGRAIRTERGNISKTANIWHLVCIDQTSSYGGDDIQLLRRRFKAFVGVSFRKEVSIENGIGRLNIPQQIISSADLEKVNDEMLSNAGQRDRLKSKWSDALENGETMIEEMKVPFPEELDYTATKSLYYNKTIKYLLTALGSGLLGFTEIAFQSFGKSIQHIKTLEGFAYWVLGIGMVGALVFGGLAFNTLRAFIKYRDISDDVKQIGEALLDTLIKIKVVHTHHTKLHISTIIDEFGAIYCHLEGGTTYEKSIFIKSLQETIGTVDNPRYIIIRKSFFMNVLSQKDYHSVPDLIGRKKEFAEFFATRWRKIVGQCELVYTRSVEGRKLILKSRFHSLASEFEEKTERVNKWR